MKSVILATVLIGSTLLVAEVNGVIRGEPEQGKRIFQERCASCHGFQGKGDGPRAPFLSPRPANLVSAGTSIKTDEELYGVITNGKPRTAMPAWKDLLTDQQRQDLVAYIRSLVRFHPKPLTPPPPNTPAD